MAEAQGLLRPRSLQEALALLDQDPSARPLAGGATLVAMMNAQVIEPTTLISLRSVPELQGITRLADGSLRIGAFTRHRDTAQHAALNGVRYVVRDAAAQIANPIVRNMGTIGGAVAFADPGLDYPPALVAARASIEVASVRGTRVLEASAFFLDWYTTALEAGELVCGVRLPPAQEGYGRYHKVARVVGDYAIASLALARAASGEFRVAVGGCGPTPLHSDEVDALLSRGGGPTALEQAATLLVKMSDPVDDARASAHYRRQLIPRLLNSAVQQARKEGA